MKRFLSFMILIFSAVVFAQEATPEATLEVSPEVTAEVSPEATSTVLTEASPESTSEAEQCKLVEEALQVTQLSCNDTSLNEACYGYIRVGAELRDEDTQFVEQGDTTSVTNIQSLQLSPMDITAGQWGVMIMQVEANVTEGDITTTDDVQVVLYGDTQVEAAANFVEMTATAQANIRRQPRTDAEVLGVVAVGESKIANARLEDNSWIRIRLSGEDTPVGWISTEFLRAATDISVLPSFTTAQAEEVPTDIGAVYGPMQAAIIQTGEDAPPCSEAPNNGILIQTPEGSASITLWMDEVVIELDGTGLVSAEADGEMTVAIIEGSAQVSANGGTSTIVAGQATDIELDSELSPTTAPSAPRPVTAEEINGVPTVLLDDPVTLPTALENNSLVPITGQWSYTLNNPAPYICSDGSEVTFATAGTLATITPQLDALNVSGVLFPEVAEGVYRGSYADVNGNLIQDTLQVTRTDRITGEKTIDFVQPACTITLSFTFQLVAPN
jgi:hypothetical protein